jgi:hypothetical protein
MTQRYRKTRPIVLLMAGWLLIGIILVTSALVHAGSGSQGTSSSQRCAAFEAAASSP